MTMCIRLLGLTSERRLHRAVNNGNMSRTGKTVPVFLLERDIRLTFWRQIRDIKRIARSEKAAEAGEERMPEELLLMRIDSISSTAACAEN